MPTQEEVINILKEICQFIATHPREIIPHTLYIGLDVRNLRIYIHSDDVHYLTHITVTYNNPENLNLSLSHRLTLSREEINRLRITTDYILPIRTRLEPGLVTPEEYIRLYQQEIVAIPGRRPTWWSFDEAKQPNFEPFKPHPPYPLIGLEYEPQLTLLNYPKKRVHVVCSGYNTRIRQTIPNDVILKIPYKFSTNIDQDNLEFRTPPVKFEDLPAEITKLQTEMESVVMEIAKAVGPVGIFLPAHPCTKHINLSGIDIPLRKDVKVKLCDYGNRYHLEVPYSFTDYNYVATAPFYYFLQEKPILLGYSMTGDSFVRRCELP